MILYLSYFILAFAILQFLVALINFLFSPRLKDVNPVKGELISILIPARNEEHNIAQLLNDLLNLSYQHIEILVYDDLSTDNTAQIVRQYCQLDHRIKLLEGKDLPKAWLGKNYACHILSTQSKGRYLLFLDADVRIEPGLINKLLHYTRRKQLRLLSVFPVQEMQSKGEWLSVPLMNYILLTLLPLPLVRLSHFSSLSAANGQCMFFEAAVYHQLKPHELLKNNKVEDIRIARLYKKRKLRIACLASVHDISCRMYTGLEEAMQGFSKNVLAFFGNSFLLALLFWIISSLGWIPLIWQSTELILAWFLSQFFMHLMVALTSHQSVGRYLWFALPRQFVLLAMMLKAERKRIRKDNIWKGRPVT